MKKLLVLLLKNECTLLLLLQIIFNLFSGKCGVGQENIRGRKFSLNSWNHILKIFSWGYWCPECNT